MTGFRTKGKGRGRKVYPIGSAKGRKTYSIGGRKNYSDHEGRPPEDSFSEGKVLEEKLQEQKAQKHKLAKPSFTTRASVNTDIKNLMRKDGSDEHGSKDFVNYKKKLDRDANRTYSRESRKGKKRMKKENKNNEKQQAKEQEVLKQQQEVKENTGDPTIGSSASPEKHNDVQGE